MVRPTDDGGQGITEHASVDHLMDEVGASPFKILERECDRLTNLSKAEMSTCSV